MNQITKITKTLSKWQEQIDDYKTESSKLQNRITRNLRTIWLQSGKFKKCDIQKLIDTAGKQKLPRVRLKELLRKILDTG